MWEFSRDAHDLLRLARPWLIRARLLLLRLLRLQHCLYTVAKLRKLRFPSFISVATVHYCASSFSHLGSRSGFALQDSTVLHSELIKDYDLEVHYHPGKANVVADALSHKVTLSLLRSGIIQRDSMQ